MQSSIERGTIESKRADHSLITTSKRIGKQKWEIIIKSERKFSLNWAVEHRKQQQQKQ